MSCRSSVRDAYTHCQESSMPNHDPLRRTDAYSSFHLLFIQCCMMTLIILLSIIATPAIAQSPLTLDTTPIPKPYSLTIGFLGSTNLPNSNTQAGGAPSLFAARLAVQHVNAQRDLLPDTQLILINNNTNSDAGTGNIMAFDQIQNRGVVALIGEYNSGVSITVAYPSRHYRIPQISYGSTSPDFTTFHDTLYPYFLRMCPSQNLESVLLAYLIKSQGWNRVGLVYTTDSPGTAGAQNFQAVATKLGVQVVGSAAFAFGASTPDIYFQLKNVKASGATILLFIGAITDFQSIMNVSTLGIDENTPPLRMHGSNYQWIGLHSCMYSTLFTNSSGSIIPHFYEFAQGIVGLQNFADVESSWYQAFVRSWNNTEKHPDLPSVDPKNPTSITIPAHFAYDSVWFYARAIHRMRHEFGVDLNRATWEEKALFLSVLKTVTFLGVSGNVSVDEKGDRFAPFNILNFQGEQLVTVGTVTADGMVTYKKDVSIQYMGGEKAADALVRGIREIGFTTRAGMMIGTIFCIILVCAGMYALIALRKKAVFKASSPPFLGLMLVGVLFLLSSMFPRIYENWEGGSVDRCLADLFLTNYAYTLIVGSMLMKALKVHSISSKQKFSQSALTDNQLGLGLFILMVIQTAILVGLCQGDEMKLQTAEFNSEEDYIYCSSNKQSTTLYTAVIMTFRFALLCVTAVYSFRIRDIPHEFNESKQLGMSIYNLLFLSILLPIIDQAMGRGKSAAVITYGISIFVIALVTSGIILLPKITMHFFLLTDPYYRNNMTHSANPQNSSSQHSKSDVAPQFERGSLSHKAQQGNLPLPFPPYHHYSPNHSPQGSHHAQTQNFQFPTQGQQHAAGGGIPRHSNSNSRSGSRHSSRTSGNDSHGGAPSLPPQAYMSSRMSYNHHHHQQQLYANSQQLGYAYMNGAGGMHSILHATPERHFPRVHIGRGVSSQFLTMLIQQLSNTQAVAAEQELMDSEHEARRARQSSNNNSASDKSHSSGTGSYTYSPSSGTIIGTSIPVRVTLPPSSTCSTLISSSLARTIPSVPSIPELELGTSSTPESQKRRLMIEEEV